MKRKNIAENICIYAVWLWFRKFIIDLLL